MKVVKWIALAALVATGVLVASGCASGGDSGESAAAPETVTVVLAGEDADTSGGDAGASSGGGDIEVPDVVGLDHQLAQDTMQAAGLYDLAEEDATGQDRMLLWDRNWTVVEQEPAAGTMVSEDETIILSSKKDDE